MTQLQTPPELSHIVEFLAGS